MLFIDVEYHFLYFKFELGSLLEYIVLLLKQSFSLMLKISPNLILSKF